MDQCTRAIAGICPRWCHSLGPVFTGVHGHGQRYWTILNDTEKPEIPIIDVPFWSINLIQFDTMRRSIFKVVFPNMDPKILQVVLNCLSWLKPSASEAKALNGEGIVGQTTDGPVSNLHRLTQAVLLSDCGCNWGYSLDLRIFRWG